MKNEATKRQKQLLMIIYDSFINTGYSPNFDEMRENLSVVSNQAVLDLLRALEHKRLIRREAYSARGITILPLGYQTLEKKPLIPFIGTTSAGSMTEAIELEGDWQKISSEVAKAQDVFLLKVLGDSMVNAGIEDNDFVLVRQGKEFSSGDIVLAQIDGESTIKRFISQDTPPYIYLKPENPKYPIISFTDDMELLGKVVGILNKHGEWKQVK